MSSTVRCGTNSGYSRHQKVGETPCPACVVAKQEYDRRRREAPDKVRKSRLSARAQGQALKTLRGRYPLEYRELYRAELAILLREDQENLL